jgi:hypothetical protein
VKDVFLKGIKNCPEKVAETNQAFPSFLYDPSQKNVPIFDCFVI